MSDEQPTDELLMRYFDGELPEVEATAVTARIERDPEYAAKFAALGNLNRAFGASTDELSAGVDFDGLYARIERGIAADAAPSAQIATPGLIERFGAWLSELMESPGQLWVPAAGLAAAAVVFFVVAQGGDPNGGTGAGSKDDVAVLPKPPPAADTSDIPPPPAPVALASSEIVQVDFGDNTGTVFEIALAEGVSTPVVWINDEE